mmetsp:Transcript_15107/g.28443  ORF Transcript_15107/g.28443 Transcript_15107/m.28443 type:complete len:113 (-) Transcript_15107:280-618(-)
MQLSWLLVVVGLLLCSELVAVVEGKKKHGNNNNLDRVWKNKRTQCEKFECGHLVVDENMNCVNNCTSALCFKEVYADEPLEDGEIDDKRQKLYNSCLRRETKNAKKAANQAN